MMETQEKIEPCAWCGEAPKETLGDTAVYYCICDTSDDQVNTGYRWNTRQTAILARRRADFEAGWKDGHQWQPDGEPYRTDDIQEFFDLYLSQPPADGET